MVKPVRQTLPRLVTLVAILCIYVGCFSIPQQATVPTLSPADQARAEKLFENWEPPRGPLMAVHPLPGSTVGLSSTPDCVEILPTSPTPIPCTPFSSATSVCAHVRVESLLEPGDHLDHWSFALHHIELTFDGRIVDRPDYLVVDNNVAVVGPDYTGPQATHICWNGLISPGLHVVDFRVWSTSRAKEYEYSWAFEAVE